MDSFVHQGHAKALEQEDLHRMRPQDQILAVQQRFEVLWKKEMERALAQDKKPSLFRVLYRLTHRHVKVQAMLELTSRAAQLGGPLVLRQIILFVGDPTIDDNRGWYLCAIVLLLAFAQGLASAHSIRLCLTAQLNATAAIRSAVFAKALRVSLASQASKSSGEIINLMSIDSDAVGQLYFSCHGVWVSPLFVGLCLWQLYFLLGPSAFIGLVAMFLLVPFMLSFMLQQKKWTRQRMKAMDQRVKFISELIQGIKVLKYNAWEDRFAELATEKRALELKKLKKLVFSQVKFHTFIM